MSNLLDQYFDLRDEVFASFGYVENWRAIPLEDSREYYWRLVNIDEQGVPGNIRFSESIDVLNDTDAGGYYEDEIYTQRHLSQWVYRNATHTMALVDTHVDGNKFLRIFDNNKEIPEPSVALGTEPVHGILKFKA